MMRLLRWVTAMAAAMALYVSTTNALTMDFENLYSAGAAGGQLGNYAGFVWSTAAYWLPTSNCNSDHRYDNSGYVNGCKDKVCIYTAGLEPDYAAQAISMSRDTVFNLTSAFITSGWKLGEDAVVEGWRNDKKEYAAYLCSLSCTGTSNYEFNFENIDTVWFKPGQQGSLYGPANGTGAHLVIDNIEYTESNCNNDMPAPVPEPGSLALLGTGFIGLVGFGRMKLIRE